MLKKIKWLDKNADLNIARNENILCLNLNTWRQCIKDERYQNIFKNSKILCDGFWSEKLIRILGYPVRQYAGPDFFLDSLDSGIFQRNCIVGSTIEKQHNLELYLKSKEVKIPIYKKPLEFLDLEEFNYNDISDFLYNNSIEIAWISLGAPKQEYFLEILSKNFRKKYPNHDISFAAIGAAIDFYAIGSQVPRAPLILRKIGLEWFWRILYQPKKTANRLTREILMLPRILINEIFNK